MGLDGKYSCSCGFVFNGGDRDDITRQFHAHLSSSPANLQPAYESVDETIALPDGEYTTVDEAAEFLGIARGSLLVYLGSRRISQWVKRAGEIYIKIEELKMYKARVDKARPRMADQKREVSQES